MTRENTGAPFGPGYSAEPEPASGLRPSGEYPSRGGWQPIATVPKDGTWFMICRHDEGGESYEIGCYDPMKDLGYEPVGNGYYRRVERLGYEWRGFNNIHRATHWMPLPPPPASAIEAAEPARRASGSIHESAVGRMPETPEQRASMIVFGHSDMDVIDGDDWRVTGKALIEALRSSENDALERSANEITLNYSHCTEEAADLAARHAARIRSLKRPEPTE